VVRSVRGFGTNMFTLGWPTDSFGLLAHPNAFLRTAITLNGEESVLLNQTGGSLMDSARPSTHLDAYTAETVCSKVFAASRKVRKSSARADQQSSYFRFRNLQAYPSFTFELDAPSRSVIAWLRQLRITLLGELGDGQWGMTIALLQLLILSLGFFRMATTGSASFRD
jgi:hypothetical protein